MLVSGSKLIARLIFVSFFLMVNGQCQTQNSTDALESNPSFKFKKFELIGSLIPLLIFIIVIAQYTVRVVFHYIDPSVETKEEKRPLIKNKQTNNFGGYAVFISVFIGIALSMHAIGVSHLDVGYKHMCILPHISHIASMSVALGLLIVELNAAVFQGHTYGKSVKYTRLSIAVTIIYQIIQIILVSTITAPTLERANIPLRKDIVARPRYCAFQPLTYLSWSLVYFPIIPALGYIGYVQWRMYKEGLRSPYKVYHRLIPIVILLTFGTLIPIQLYLYTKYILVLYFLRQFLSTLGWVVIWVLFTQWQLKQLRQNTRVINVHHDLDDTLHREIQMTHIK